MIPRLKIIDYSKKKHHYKLDNTTKQRHLAIDEGIDREKKKTRKNIKKAALAKKARFNVLRIYRKYKNKKECEIITRDMKYIDKKYKLGKTNNICKTLKKSKKKTKKYRK